MAMNVIICTVPTTYSRLPPIMVEEDHDCDECGSTHELEKCPLCGSWISFNYGMGSYAYCNNEECDWRYETGCGGWIIQDSFTSEKHYKESERYPIHCNVHDCHAWICFNGD